MAKAMSSTFLVDRTYKDASGENQIVTQEVYIDFDNLEFILKPLDMTKNKIEDKNKLNAITDCIKDAVDLAVKKLSGN